MNGMFAEKIDPEIYELMHSHNIKREGRTDSNQDSGQQVIPSNNGSDDDEGVLTNIKFSVTCLNMCGTETLRDVFSGNDCVSKVSEAILNQVPAINKDFGQRRARNRAMGMTLIINGKGRDMNTPLSLIKGIRGNGQLNTPIHISFSVNGGSNSNDEKENIDGKERDRLADFKNEKRIKPTLKPDCIFGYNEKKLRVQMPCGHVFDSFTLFKLTKMYVSNLSKTAIVCPVLKCQKKWDFNVVAAAADLDEREQIEVLSILSARVLLHSGNYKKCKNCKGLVDKPDGLKMIRVRCSGESCRSRKDFCWCCGKDWIGDGFTVCGNDDCGTKAVNDLLKSCLPVKPEYLGGKIECPAIRVCPRCLALVRWKSACKHMRCWGCNKEFCFVCLGLKSDKGKWPCGDHTTHCKVADRQSLK